MALTESFRKAALMTAVIGAVLLIFTGAVFFSLSGIPVSGAFFNALASDRALTGYLAGRLMHQIPASGIQRNAVFKRVIPREIASQIRGSQYRNWLRFLEEGKAEVLRFDFRKLKSTLLVRFAADIKITTFVRSLPKSCSLFRAGGVGRRERRILLRFAPVYKRVSEWRYFALLFPLFLVSGMLIPKEGRMLRIRAAAFVSSVIWITLFIFIIAFRQQVTDLGLTILAQLSRNTVIEKAVVRGALNTASAKLFLQSVVFGGISFALLLFCSFGRKQGERTNSGGVPVEVDRTGIRNNP